MPISPSVPTSQPADATQAYFAQQVQNALDTIAGFVNGLETSIGDKLDDNAQGRLAAATAAALLTIAQTGTGNALVIERSGGGNALTVDDDGVTAIGDQPSNTKFGNGAQLKITGGVLALVEAYLAAFGNNANGYELHFYKSRSANVDTRDSVAANDMLGGLSFDGDAGASEEQGAYLRAEVDGALLEAATITSIVRATNVVTLTTQAAHGFAAADAIAVEDVSKPDFNGNFVITALDGVDPTRKFTYAQTANNDSDTTGKVAMRNLPARIVMATRAAGATLPVERFRIAANGDITLTGQFTNRSRVTGRVLAAISLRDIP